MTAPDPADELTATLEVGLDFSVCGHCRGGVLLDATRHDTIVGYLRHGEPGCGARFTAITALYTAITSERLQQLRPDLLVVGQDAASWSPPARPEEPSDV